MHWPPDCMPDLGYFYWHFAGFQRCAGVAQLLRIITNNERNYMLGWTLLFLVIALVAGVLGFTSIAGAAAGIAQILFIVFLVLFLASLVSHLLHSR